MKYFILTLIFSLSPAAAAFAEGQPPAWDGTPAPIADIRIEVHHPNPGGPDWQDLARVLTGLKPGDTLTAEALEQARNAIAPLAQVQMQVAVQPRGLLLQVDLTPYGRIKEIHISGNYPLLEKQVRTAMTIAAGQVFRAAEIPQQEALVERLYRNQGYIDPKVKITWQEGTDGHYDLRVHIQKGPAYQVVEIRLLGNASIGDTALKLRMSTWRRRLLDLGRERFTRKSLEEDVRRLIGYYRSRGFADVSIETETRTHGPQNRRVTLVFRIAEGPRYQVQFSGNQFFSDRRLRKELVLFEAGNRGNIGLRRSVYQIRRRYVQAGFADVQVRWHASGPSQQGVEEVRIEIQEGRRRLVEAIEIQGNRQIDADAIRGQMLTRRRGILHQGAFVPEMLQEDLTAIEALYRGRGFLSARVGDKIAVDPQNGRVRITIEIAEGPRTRVAELRFEGEPPVQSELLTKGLRLKPGAPYTPMALSEDEDTIAARVSPHGYPYVAVQGRARLSEDQQSADVGYTVAPGQHVAVGQIFLLGNFKTSDRFIRHDLRFRTGDDFSLQAVLDGQRRLRDLEIFDSVQVNTIGLKEQQQKVNLLLQTIEKEPYYFLAGAGYQSDTGFYGRARLGDRNFTGTAKDLWISGSISQIGYRADLGLGDPRFLGTLVRADADFYAQRSEPLNQDFGTMSRGARLTFSRAWERKLSTALSLSGERREQFLRDSASLAQQADPSAFIPRTVVAVIPSVVYDTRDSFINPTRGYMLSGSVDLSKGLTNSLDDFLKYRAEARAFYSPFKRLTLAGRIWAGYLEPYGASPPPLDQLFYLGGLSSVRGFGENLLRVDAAGNAVGGRLALAAGLETRIDLGADFQLVPFVDTGSVRQPLVEAGSDAFRWSTGLGLQYLTPVGPIGLFYGRVLNPQPGRSRSHWHLSIGYSF